MTDGNFLGLVETLLKLIARIIELVLMIRSALQARKDKERHK